MGMNDDVWPPPPRPNPLFPAELQRAAGAPHASAEIEVDFASRVHARLLLSSPAVTFSCSAMAGNRLLQPSPLLAGLPQRPAHSVAVVTLAGQLLEAAMDACERIDDYMAPPLAEGEKVSGGSWLLRAQAICPAWGFYQYRLGAEAMETPVEGLDPAARGTLVHAALEAFWTAVRDSASFADLLPAAWLAAIEAAAEVALLDFEVTRRVTLPARFRQLEAQRLQRLLAAWLAVEAKRSEAFTVIACEQPAEIEIEQIRVKMVVDRIDQLADGRRIIIDYKTGAAIDIHNWAEDRLTEPQLPIYAALVAAADSAVDAVAAVVFAKVLLDKPAFAGVAEERDLLPGVQGIGDEKQKIFDPQRFPDWPSVLAHWRTALKNIALEVKAGVAGVSFSDAAALQYCEVKPLLRLAERARQEEKTRVGEVA
jgi:exodeoxyribonuclease-5